MLSMFALNFSDGVFGTVVLSTEWAGVFWRFWESETSGLIGVSTEFGGVVVIFK